MRQSICYPNKRQQTMQAYETEQPDQGLFTFYRQQAELQQQLKIKKKQQLAKMRQSQSENMQITRPRRISQRYAFKHSEGAKKESTEERISVERQKGKPNQEKQHKQFEKQLIDILQKHKYNRRRQNAKEIMKQGGNNQIALKYHLQALMRQQNQLDFAISQQKKSALQGEIDQIPQNSPKNCLNLMNRGQMSSIYSKQLWRSFEQNAEKQAQTGEYSQMNPPFLPKIQYKTNKINSYNSVGLGKIKQSSLPSKQLTVKPLAVAMEKLKKVKSMRDKPLCAASARYNARYTKQVSKVSSSCDNKIYSIFIENKQSKKQDDQAKINKQQIFTELIRKFKFN